MHVYYHGTSKMNKEILYEMRKYLYSPYFHTFFVIAELLLLALGVIAFFRGQYVSAVLYPIAIFFIKLEYSWLLKIAAKKVVKGFKEMGFSEIVSDILITEDGIVIKNPEADNSITIAYDNISRIVELDTFILFLTKQNQPNTLLKDTLSDDVKCDFLDMIKKKNPKIKIKNIV